MRNAIPSESYRVPASVLILAIATALVLGCDNDDVVPKPGLPEYRQLGSVSLPGGTLDTWNRNFMARRIALSIDTRLGTREIGVVYNSSSNLWLWSFEVTYDGSWFTDPTGTRYKIADVAHGKAIPGTNWVKVDGSTIKTKGGLVHEFDESGRLSAVRWSSSAYPRLVYLGAPITDVIQCYSEAECYDVFDITRDPAGRVIEISDRAGRSAIFDYDPTTGRLIQAQDALDIERSWPGHRYEYSGDGSRLSARISSEGERIDFEYSGTGGVLSFVRQVGDSNPEYHITRVSGSTRITDPRGHTTGYRWDSAGSLVEIEQIDLGETVSFEWSGRRVSKRTMPTGIVTTWTYENDDVATHTQPSGNVVQYAYEPNGANRDQPEARAILSITDSVGAVENRGYSAEGRLQWVENGEGERTEFTYDSLGEIATLQLPSGQVASFGDYGEHGKPATVDWGDNAVDERTYDAVGNQLTGSSPQHVLDAGGPGIVSRIFDGNRNLAALEMVQEMPLSTEPLLIERRSDGRIATIRRPSGGEARFNYDSLGRLASRQERVDEAWQSTLFTYDEAGNLVAVELPNGMRRERGFDEAGRVNSLRYRRWGVLEQSISYVYENGRIKSTVDSSHAGIEIRSFDFAGRTSAVSLATGEHLMFGYDLRSRPTRLDLRRPDWSLLRRLSLAYDLENRETFAADGATTLRLRTFSNGQLASESFGNGISRVYSYDPAGGHLVSPDYARRLKERRPRMR